MVPELYICYLRFLWKLNEMLLLGGRAPVVTPGGVNALFVNTAGIDLVLIGIFVLYASRDPLSRRFIVAVNAAARLVFAGIILYYAVVYDIARIVLLIGCVDVVISVVFVCYLLLLRKRRTA